jgi:quinol monooxygenase YgiN
MADDLDIVVTLRMRAGWEAEAEALLRETEAATLANDEGCLRYEWRRAETSQTYMLLERWTDQEAVRARLRAPHIAITFERMKSMLAEPFTPLVLAKL